jgi:hypothetical protein
MTEREGYEPLLVEMLPMYRAHVEPGHVSLREGCQRSAFLGHGWFLRCQRGIEALLLLGDAGYAEEASPLRRSIIEHVVALRWIAVKGDDILPTVARGQAWSAQKRRDSAAEAKWASIDLDDADRAIASAEAAATNPANNCLNIFIERAKRYADVHALPGWYAECARSHAGYESAVSYVEIDLPSQSLLMEPRQTVWQVPFATSQLFMALGAVRELFDPKPWEDELTNLRARYLELTDRVRAEDGLPPVDWSTGEIADLSSGSETTRS